MADNIKVSCGMKRNHKYMFVFNREDLARYASRFLRDYKEEGKGSFVNNARRERMRQTITRLLDSKNNQLSLENICNSVNISQQSMLSYLRHIKYILNPHKKISQDYQE